MKQKVLLQELYRANLNNDKKALGKLYQQELKHILAKRKAGKTNFSPKWCVTDESQIIIIQLTNKKGKVNE